MGGTGIADENCNFSVRGALSDTVPRTVQYCWSGVRPENVRRHDQPAARGQPLDPYSNTTVPISRRLLYRTYVYQV